MTSERSPRFDEDNATTKPQLCPDVTTKPQSGPGATTEPRLDPGATTESQLAHAVTTKPNTKKSLLLELCKKIQASKYKPPPLYRLIQTIEQQSESKGLLMEICRLTKNIQHDVSIEYK